MKDSGKVWDFLVCLIIWFCAGKVRKYSQWKQKVERCSWLKENIFQLPGNGTFLLFSVFVWPELFIANLDTNSQRTTILKQQNNRWEDIMKAISSSKSSDFAFQKLGSSPSLHWGDVTYSHKKMKDVLLCPLWRFWRSVSMKWKSDKQMSAKAWVIFKHQITEDETIWEGNIAHRAENSLLKPCTALVQYCYRHF